MNPTANQPTVILRHCDGYDVSTIRRLVREGMKALGLQPRGRTLAKPNLVSAGPLFQHAYTRPEVMEGVPLFEEEAQVEITLSHQGRADGAMERRRSDLHRAELKVKESTSWTRACSK